MPAPAGLPREAISQMIAHVLGLGGRTVAQVEREAGRRYPGDGSQEALGDRPVWHTRQGLIAEVAARLRIHPRYLGPRRVSSDFQNAVDQEIARLRRGGMLADWDGARPCGVWRPTGLLPASGPPAMTAAEAPAPRGEDAGGQDMKRAFLAILSRGTKSNTYKFTLAKSLLDYCSEVADGSPRTHAIPYRYFASKFLKYYWYQEYKFRMKQDFHANRKPKVVTALNDVFGSSPPARFDLLDPGDVRRAEDKILRTVFGHARSKTSLVIPRFQNVKSGRYVERHDVFYDYDDDEQVLYLRPGAFEFFRRNHGLLSKAVLAEWAKYLERINRTLPRLVAKIEQDEAQRGPLAEYRAMFSRHTRHCFYCRDRLERGCVHVDHFIPWSYMFDDDAWNLVLACGKCNLKKSDSLAGEEFRDLLLRRNGRYSGKIRRLKLSLDQLDSGRGWRPEIVNHYENCAEYGFGRVRMP